MKFKVRNSTDWETLVWMGIIICIIIIVVGLFKVIILPWLMRYPDVKNLVGPLMGMNTS